ncbi:hypothetical protein HDF18_01025 [Mucilaginibacter sp. X5P1]|uniref:hypothetical protein n=1 Tax=Mucilaginibacter sp. X5P1 TaxID=2723088 RepID=UPI001616FB35|nr:hypothetical protein [Mucilaginibacter sp. X5P1]MBB6138318.1 hypothetical protein [Mucilaginibacter sp. X5P1]
MKKVLHISKSVALVILTCIYSNLRAQKIQSVQEGNLWAPSTVKIDGKLTEWGTTLQAYNKTVKLWYTIANDDKNIYLAIKSTDMDNNNKILAGGISFILNTAGKKKDKNAFNITYPMVSHTGGGGRGGRSRKGFGQQDTPDTASIIAQQKQTLATAKELSALGFKDITDTVISIYNEYSIKAVANIDDKEIFVYELSIPLKLLDIAPGDQKEIAYDIKVNGLQLGSNSISIGGGGTRISGGGGGFGGGFGGGGGGPTFGGGKSLDVSDMMSPTDFWGKYTLATGATK